MAETDTARTIRRIKEEYADAYDTMTWLPPATVYFTMIAEMQLISLCLY
jgi:hypothetical protein